MVFFEPERRETSSVLPGTFGSDAPESTFGSDADLRIYLLI